MNSYLVATRDEYFMLIKPRIIKARSTNEAEKIYKSTEKYSWCLWCGIFINEWKHNKALKRQTFEQLLKEADKDLKDYFESTQADLQSDE